MMNIFLLMGVVSSMLSSCDRDIYSSDAGYEPSPNKAYEMPAPLRHLSEVVIDHSAFRVSYNPDTRCPNYVAWHLTRSRVDGKTKRSNVFMPDTLLAEQYRVETMDYSQSGYDRGHMCPAADCKESKKMMEESFMMSNICPQNRNLNAGDWTELETLCREWVCNYSDLYIVCGPIFDSNHPRTIGRTGRPRIAVPDRFFKVVLMLGVSPKAIGFIYPNDDTNKDVRSYCVSVDDVETITGIDFYPALPKRIEREVESMCNPAQWGI